MSNFNCDIEQFIYLFVYGDHKRTHSRTNGRWIMWDKSACVVRQYNIHLRSADKLLEIVFISFGENMHSKMISN